MRQLNDMRSLLEMLGDKRFGCYPFIFVSAVRTCQNLTLLFDMVRHRGGGGSRSHLTIFRCHFFAYVLGYIERKVITEKSYFYHRYLHEGKRRSVYLGKEPNEPTIGELWRWQEERT
jgi:hypothetical protein